MKQADTQVLNLSDIDTKRRLMSKIGSLSGLWEVTVRQRKLTRSLNQNAYYWAAFVTPFAEWINENWGEKVTLEQAHDTLKLALLEVPRVTNEGGESIAVMPSSKTLNTQEFAAYLERAAEFLARICSIAVLPAEMFYEAPERGQRHRAKPNAQPARQSSAKLKATGDQHEHVTDYWRTRESSRYCPGGNSGSQERL